LLFSLTNVLQFLAFNQVELESIKTCQSFLGPLVLAKPTSRERENGEQYENGEQCENGEQRENSEQRHNGDPVDKPSSHIDGDSVQHLVRYFQPYLRLDALERLSGKHIAAALKSISFIYSHMRGLVDPIEFQSNIYYNFEQDNILDHLDTDGIRRFDSYTYILHAKDHWVTLTNVNPNDPGSWLLYDSLNKLDYLEYLLPVLRKFSAEVDILKVDTVIVPPQVGASDCGLMALAYVIAICEGQDPARRVFDQGSMRRVFNTWVQFDCLVGSFRSEEIGGEPIYTSHYLDLSAIPVYF
jgi:hypothetical protein